MANSGPSQKRLLLTQSGHRPAKRPTAFTAGLSQTTSLKANAFIEPIGHREAFFLEEDGIEKLAMVAIGVVAK